MAKAKNGLLFARSLQRTLSAMTRSVVRASTKSLKQTLRATPVKRKPVASLPRKSNQMRAVGNQTRPGVAITATGPRRYRLFKPLGVRRHEKLPLLVMLHGCGQDASGLSTISRMNRIAERERFLVLYPEQDRMANAQGCWNWYDTRTGRAQAEADSLLATITQISTTQPVDNRRIALAGLSAGAGMAALLAIRHPLRFQAVAMHSGIGPGVAHSSVSALSAMAGRRTMAAPAAPLASGTHLPALLVIQGTSDAIVASTNGREAARMWAAAEGAHASEPREVQRGARYAMRVTDYRTQGRLVATLCEVSALGHAWSGGAAGYAYSDPKGPDASRLIWSFVSKQFKLAFDQETVVKKHLGTS